MNFNPFSREVLLTRLFLGAVFLFLVSMCMSWQELEYRIWGQTTTATLIGTHTERDTSRGGPRLIRVAEYAFMDRGQWRRDYRDVPLDWSGQKEPTVQIQYIPGKERRSRLAGETNLLWVTLFLGSVGAVLIGGAALWWQGSRR